MMAACAPPKPNDDYYSGNSRSKTNAPVNDDDEEPAKDAGTSVTPVTSDGGKINKAACNLTTAVEEKSGNITCKAGTGLAPNKTGGKPVDGTYVLSTCSYFDGAVEKPSARGTIRVTGEIMEYIDEAGYIGGAFVTSGSMLNIYGAVCTTPPASATPTLAFGFSIDGNDIVRIRDEPGQPVRVLRFTKQ